MERWAEMVDFDSAKEKGLLSIYVVLPADGDDTVGVQYRKGVMSAADRVGQLVLHNRHNTQPRSGVLARRTAMLHCRSGAIG